MPTRTLNLGILAHVDAGKTSLTERLLFDNGTISALGSVDSGSTQTDTSELERRRGITIRSAVASFNLEDLQVNLVDTPGHPDFIAEVERALSVLDAAVLVISAVEGVQAQTRVLMRSLKKLRLPTLVFVNKIDRMGARHDDLLADISGKIAPLIVPMNRVAELGTKKASVHSGLLGDESLRVRAAEILAENDDALLTRIVEDSLPSRDELQVVLARQTLAGLVHPVFFGSALSGAGARELTDGMRTLLPPPLQESSELRGTVFAIERASGGEKIAYLRLFSGELRERQRVTFRRRATGGLVEELPGRISGLAVVGSGPDSPKSSRGRLTAGNIAKLRGLPQVRVGDQVGDADGAAPAAQFSPPILETVVRPREQGREPELHTALSELADEDPLIRTRTVGGGATSVQLYGAVQKEVIADRLRLEFGIEAVFEQIRPVYFERPLGTGASLAEFDPRGGNDFWATIGLRVEAAPVGAGNSFTRQVQWGALPAAYHRAIEDSALRTLEQGLFGWEVTDCAITLTRIGYEAPMSVAADFRNLTPLVLMRALKEAGSRVYEPTYALEVEVPGDALSGVIGLLTSLGADIAQSARTGSAYTITGEIPARLLQDVAIALPGLTHGEGALWSGPGSDRQVRDPVPVRERFDGNPLDYVEYIRFLSISAVATRA